MAFTKDQLKTLPNPYEVLNTGDALEEHAASLNSLNLEEKVQLATRIIATCPDNQLHHYHNALNRWNALLSDDEDFFTILNHAWEVKSILVDLQNPEIEQPHEKLMECNTGYFHQFKELVNQLLMGKEKAMATRLALTTPEKDRNAVLRKIQNLFSHVSFGDDLTLKNTLSPMVGRAFILQTEITHHLLGNEPEVFFTSENYNPDLCNEFPEVLSANIRGHEELIGKKLAKADDYNLHTISRNLELINRKAQIANNSFRKIAETMTAYREFFKNLAEVEKEIQVLKKQGETIQDLNDVEDFEQKMLNLKEGKKAIELANKLTVIIQTLKNPDTNPKDYNKNQLLFNDLINTEGNFTHREIWKPILLNILIAFTGIGLLAITAKLLVTGRAFFAETKREQILNGIADNFKAVETEAATLTSNV